MSKESKHTRKEILEVSGIGDIVSQLKKLNAAAKIDKMQEIEMAKNAPALLAATEGMGSVQDAFVDNTEDFRRRFIASVAASSFSDIRKGQGWMGRGEDEDGTRVSSDAAASSFSDIRKGQGWMGRGEDEDGTRVSSDSYETIALIKANSDKLVFDTISIKKAVQSLSKVTIDQFKWQKALTKKGSFDAVESAREGGDASTSLDSSSVGKESGGGFLSALGSIKMLALGLGAMGAAITAWVAKSTVFKWIKSLGSKGGVAKIFKKIFLPIAVLFSLFKGVTAFMETEGSFYEKLTSGVSVAIGNFFGGFLDLIKGAVSWVLDLMGFGKLSASLDSFSFEDLFTDMIRGLFNVVGSAIDWVKLIFSDPGEALSQLWKAYVGEGGLLDILWTPYNKAITWVQKKFGWRDEDAPDFNLLQFIKDTWDIVVQKVMQGFREFGAWISLIPSRLKLYAMETIHDIPLVGSRLIDEDDIKEQQRQIEQRRKEILEPQKVDVQSPPINVGSMNSGNNSNNQVINTTFNGGINEQFVNLTTSLTA